MQYDREDKAAFPLKTLGLGIAGVVGVFGFGFLGTIQGVVKDLKDPVSKTASLKTNAGEQVSILLASLTMKLQAVHPLTYWCTFCIIH